MLRELARLLSLSNNRVVVVVDKSMEIAGTGVVPHTAIGNANSLLVSVDSRTRYLHVRFINNPGDYKIKLQEILAFYAKYQKITKAIRFDRGSEFLSQSSRDFITSKDILIEPSTNYDHHQAGLAEVHIKLMKAMALSWCAMHSR